MSYKKYSPENYTISVRRERHENDFLWVARVAELPDIMEFGDSREDAYSSAVYTIQVGQEMCEEDGTTFPSPISFEVPDYSGRVTLRLRASTKIQAVKIAEAECVSLNSFLNSCIEREIGARQGANTIYTSLTSVVDKHLDKIFRVQASFIRSISNAMNSSYSLRMPTKHSLIAEDYTGDEYDNDDSIKPILIKYRSIHA